MNTAGSVEKIPPARKKRLEDGASNRLYFYSKYL